MPNYSPGIFATSTFLRRIGLVALTSTVNFSVPFAVWGANARPPLKKAPAAKKATKPGAPHNSKAPAVKPKPVAAQPFVNGAGIFVGEPVVMGSDAASSDLAAFGAACSRWLQFNVGGQTDLGKTPLWNQVESARIELKRTNLQLKVGDADRFSRALGLTHLMLGDITEKSAGHYSLGYHLFDVNSAKPLGAGKAAVAAKPLAFNPVLEGSKAEIWAQLPKLAVSLSAALGVKTSRLVVQGEISEAEMSLLGRGQFTHEGDLEPEELGPLSELASREPLAALLAFEYTIHQGFQTDWQYEDATKLQYRYAIGNQQGQTFCDSALKVRMFKELMAKAGDNALVLGEICHINVDLLTPRLTDSALIKQFQAVSWNHVQNYALQTAESEMANYDDWPKDSLNLARRTTLASPKNPHSWLLLCWSAGNFAQRIRQGRTADAISEKDWTALGKLYGIWETAARQAVTLDPENVEGWQELDVSATFAGDNAVANAAFWRAYHLDPTNSSTLSWGLQQFQQKWGGNPKDLALVIGLASQTRHLPYVGLSAARVLRDLGDTAGADEIANKIRLDAEKQVADHPDDALRLYHLIDLKLRSREVPIQEVTRLTQLLPNSSLAFWVRGRTMDPSNLGDAVISVRRAIELDGSNDILRRDIGTVLIRTGNFQEAVDQSLLFLKAHPYEYLGYVNLGWAYNYLDKPELVIDASQKLLKLNPGYEDPPFYFHLTHAQTSTGHIDDALKSATKTIAILTALYAGQDVRVGQTSAFQLAWAHAYYALALTEKGQLDQALSECNEAYKLDPTNAGAHYCVGEIDWARGEKDKAKAEWESVVANQGQQQEEPVSRGYYAMKASGKLTANGLK